MSQYSSIYQRKNNENVANLNIRQFKIKPVAKNLIENQKLIRNLFQVEPMKSETT